MDTAHQEIALCELQKTVTEIYVDRIWNSLINLDTLKKPPFTRW